MCSPTMMGLRTMVGLGRHPVLSTRGYGPSLKGVDSADWMGFELGALLCNVTAND